MHGLADPVINLRNLYHRLESYHSHKSYRSTDISGRDLGWSHTTSSLPAADPRTDWREHCTGRESQVTTGSRGAGSCQERIVSDRQLPHVVSPTKTNHSRRSPFFAPPTPPPYPLTLPMLMTEFRAAIVWLTGGGANVVFLSRGLNREGDGTGDEEGGDGVGTDVGRGDLDGAGGRGGARFRG
jgi:hypothetical protein